MIDIETLGNKSNSVITQISAVEFDLKTGETFKEFNFFINPQSCLDLGLKMNWSTVFWWMQQGDIAIDNFLKCNDGLNLREALLKFTLFFNEEYDGYWGNSARFDFGILENAFDSCNIEYPFYFWLERDVRTILMLDPLAKNKFENHLAHDGISDCKFQIEYICDIFGRLEIKD